MTDNTDAAIQEAFENGEGEGWGGDITDNNPSWDFNVMGPSAEESAAFKLEGERVRRERLLMLAIPHWESVGTKGVIDLASAFEEYVNNG